MNSKRYLYLNSRDDFYRIDISKIVYFEADGNYTKVVMCNKQQGLLSMNLSKAQTMLSTNLKEASTIFARIGKRFIINRNYVFHIQMSRQHLILSDGSSIAFRLPMSKDALKKLRDIYVQGANVGKTTKTDIS